MGTKYQPSLFYFPVFKFCFWLLITFFMIFMAIKSFDVLKVGFYIFHREFLGFFLLQDIPSLLQYLMLHHNCNKKLYSRHILSIIRVFPGIKYFYQLQSLVFTTGALFHINTKLLQHANLYGDLHKPFMQRQFHFL